MKRTFHPLQGLTALVLALMILPACESGFEDLNVNPTAATSIHPQYLLPTTQLAIAGTRYEQWRGNLIYSSSFIQHLANSYYAHTYSEGSDDWRTALWRVAYNGNGDPGRAYIVTLQDIIANNSDDPLRVNYVAAARVLRVFAFQRLTDVYGDLPYFEGGLGFLNDEITPTYDPQSEIYADMLNELQEAAAQFDAGAEFNGDLLYGGDTVRWQRFAHSMMLRLGMRLVKVNQGMAQEWVQRAIAAGVMQDNNDTAYIQHQDGPNVGPNGLNSNGVSDTFATDSPLLAEFFVEWMKENNDPRLPIFSAMYDGNAHLGGNIISTDPEDQIGYPIGFDIAPNTIQDHPAYDPDLGLASFAQPNLIIRDLRDPTFLQTYAEVSFLLAEAAIRGWHTGSAQQHYEDGVRAAMQHVALYDEEGAATIDESEIDAYLTENPFDGTLEQINTQYWAATFLNGYEAWANYRRTGFPAFQPVNYPGNPTGGTVPRRLMYPPTERDLNPENYQAAISRQGPDVFTTRVWWDVQ